MSDRENLTQEEFAAYRAGDEAAVSRYFDLYGAGVYSYLLTRSGDHDRADDATVRTFQLVAEPIEGEISSDPVVVMFGTARRVAREQGMMFPVPEGDDLRSQALAAMSGLGVRDRDLMAIEALGGLDDDQVEEAAGLDPSHATDVLNRTRRRVSGALGPLLVARFGADECADLRGLVGEWDGSFPDSKRASVNRHVSSCQICARSRDDLVAPSAVLPALLTVAPSPELRDRVLSEVVVVPEPQPDPEPEPEPDPEPEPTAPIPAPPPEPAAPSAAPGGDGRGRNDLIMLGVFVLLAAGLGLVGFVVSDRFEPLELPAAVPETTVPPPGPTTTTPSPSSSTTMEDDPTSSTTVVAATPANFEVSAESVNFGGTGTTGQFEITNTGGQPGQATVESSSEVVILAAGTIELGPGETRAFDVGLDREAVEEGEINETITIRWEGGELELVAVGTQIDNPIIHNPQASPSTVQAEGDGCTNTRSTISARIRDTSSFEAVVRWSPDGGGSRDTAMTDVGGDIYEAQIGPFTVEQSASARIVATDDLGNAGGASVTIQVEPCS